RGFKAEIEEIWEEDETSEYTRCAVVTVVEKKAEMNRKSQLMVGQQAAACGQLMVGQQAAACVDNLTNRMITRRQLRSIEVVADFLGKVLEIRKGDKVRKTLTRGLVQQEKDFEGRDSAMTAKKQYNDNVVEQVFIVIFNGELSKYKETLPEFLLAPFIFIS
ncbi:Regulatory protein AriR, partial [Bienertia sinuspersici]